MKTYNKKVCTHQDHIDLLQERGLYIPDTDKAILYIGSIGYYRLTGYMYHLQLSDGSHQFKEGNSFDDVLDHYALDKALRNLLSDYLERIEVALRAKLTNNFCTSFGFFWYTDKSKYANHKVFGDIVEEISERFKTSHELFVRNFRSNYSGESMPPCNMALELLSFGKLSKMYEGLNNTVEKQNIAREFKLTNEILSSWLIHLTNVRNVCAHHSRLWNRQFVADRPLLPSRDKYKFKGEVPPNFQTSLYGTIGMLNRLLNEVNPGHEFISKLKILLDTYPIVNTAYMGFPNNWKEEAVWEK